MGLKCLKRIFVGSAFSPQAQNLRVQDLPTKKRKVRPSPLGADGKFSIERCLKDQTIQVCEKFKIVPKQGPINLSIPLCYLQLS